LLGWVRAKIAWILSREYGVALAEISRKLGVCTSAIAKAIRKKEGEDWADF
jgi:predicted transcriptional regulator